MRLRILVALAFMAACLVNTGTASATSGWVVQYGANPDKLGDSLSAVAALSPTDAWAVGGVGEFDGNALIEHWDGTRWKFVPNPVPGYMFGVTAISANDVWAVGDGPNVFTEHWNGTQWSVVPTPQIPSLQLLYSVSGTSSNDVWAVGTYIDSNNNDHPLTLHWDGTQWSFVAAPSASSSDFLYSVVAIAADDVWAVGSSNNLKATLSEHWNGSTWQIVPSPNPYPGPQSLLNAVTATSSTNVLAAGVSARSFVLRWNGSAWIVEPAPASPHITLNGISASTKAGAWAVGQYYTTRGYTVTERNAPGGAIIVPSPNPGVDDGLYGVSVVPGTQNVWAVGVFYGNKGMQVLIEYYSP